MTKRRLTVTIDDALAAEASLAVAAGRAESLSAWINDAIAAKLARDHQLDVLAELIGEYEAEHGEITEEEMEQQAQWDRDAAASVRAQTRRAG